jgi:hypothetical protein
MESQPRVIRTDTCLAGYIIRNRPLAPIHFGSRRCALRLTTVAVAMFTSAPVIIMTQLGEAIRGFNPLLITLDLPPIVRRKVETTTSETMSAYHHSAQVAPGMNIGNSH